MRHSNVLPHRRRRYMESFKEEWLPVLQGFPVTVSIQAEDLLLLGLTEADFTGVELIQAPWAHFLPTIAQQHDSLVEHAKWQMRHGVRGNAVNKAWFLPEYDAPNWDLLPQEGAIVPVMPAPHVVLYSECDTGDVVVDPRLKDFQALHFRGNIAVPMHATDRLSGPFYIYQRFPTDENLKKVIDTVRGFVESESDEQFIWYLDLEAPIVGSHHGLQVWKNLFAALKREGLDSAFGTISQMAPHWHRVAERPIDTPASRLVGRVLGVKWTKYGKQLGLFAQIAEAARERPPASDAHHALLATAFGSDLFSGICSKLDPPKALDADLGPLPITFDNAVIQVALTALACYRAGGAKNPAKAMRELGLPEDEQWFANRSAALLERMGW
jgi:hypothetical protein